MQEFGPHHSGGIVKKPLIPLMVSLVACCFNGLQAAEVGESDLVTAKSVCGEGEEVEPTACLPDTMPLQQSQANATLYMRNVGCTAWVVKAADIARGALVLTAGHCGNSQTDRFVFNFKEPCTGGTAPQSSFCRGVRIAREGNLDDYTVYELDKSCEFADSVTPILLDVGLPEEGEGIYIIGHPNRRPQLISHQEVHDNGHHCEVRNQFLRRGSKRLAYLCDTQGGNSGSPVFSARSGRAFAIHTHGGCRDGGGGANSGSSLSNMVNVLDEFGVPYVDRATTDILLPSKFEEIAGCVEDADGRIFVKLEDKGQAECESLCVNALKCVGYEYSASSKLCEITYEQKTTDMIGVCEHNLHFFKKFSAVCLAEEGSFLPEPPKLRQHHLLPPSDVRTRCHARIGDFWGWVHQCGYSTCESTIALSCVCIQHVVGTGSILLIVALFVILGVVCWCRRKCRKCRADKNKGPESEPLKP